MAQTGLFICFWVCNKIGGPNLYCWKEWAFDKTLKLVVILSIDQKLFFNTYTFSLIFFFFVIERDMLLIPSDGEDSITPWFRAHKEPNEGKETLLLKKLPL